MKRIAILASGSGTNAEKIIQYFNSSKIASVVTVGTNKEDAGVIERAKRLGVPHFTFNKKELENGSVKALLMINRVDLIVLAGFLLKIPDNLVQGFPRGIVNIHPALLPKFGGKGMYGINVHKAVKESGEKQSGITIHWVNEHYDDGEHIFQDRVDLSPGDTPEQIAAKVQELEHKHYPKVIENLLK
ncbi:phosphoribosylglycinamide formyltransferase [Pleomorphovibrio marinus]|uniref:phosphoribosylglycinamide formyltransferase n=1 Tax=Pleomorphovibrio marinus TaxID=2164132 RepID=UPI000E0A3856|nr:phosphoribosylglycinamide formyltransferase [Pleomorphovibrio marinus]